jgi:hypothetical protein
MRRSLESALSLMHKLGPTQCFITTHDRMFSAGTYEQEAARLAAFLDLPDHDAFSGFIAGQIRDPEKFSIAEQTTPTPTSLRDVDTFFADQPDAPVFSQLVRELGLWTAASPEGVIP